MKKEKKKQNTFALKIGLWAKPIDRNLKRKRTVRGELGEAEPPH
jgi:hypothetical protein